MAFLAAEAAAQLAQQLPNGVAAGVTAGVTRKEEHRANLLFLWYRKKHPFAIWTERLPKSSKSIFGGRLGFVSRGHEDCNRFVTILQAVSFSSPIIGLTAAASYG